MVASSLAKLDDALARLADRIIGVDLFRRVLRDLWLAGRSIPTPRALRLEVVETGPWLELRVVREADLIDP
jgi:hypothetical protein